MFSSLSKGFWGIERENFFSIVCYYIIANKLRFVNIWKYNAIYIKLLEKVCATELLWYTYFK